MKKIIAFFIIIMSFVGSISFVHAEQEPKEMFYAPPDIQEEIYQMSQNPEKCTRIRTFVDRGFKLVKESIAPVYLVSLNSFAKTGKITLTPKKNMEGNQVYVAKFLLPDGRYGGNIKLSVTQDGLFGGSIQYSFECKKFMIENGDKIEIGRYANESCSYADHAERIRKMLNKDEFIPVSDVKYIGMNNGFGSMGSFFLIDYNGEQVIIPAGSKYTDSNETYPCDEIISFSYLYEQAKMYLKAYEFSNKVSEWFEEHPGEEFPYRDEADDLGTPFIPYGTCSQVENIINVYEYLGIDSADNDTTEPTETPVVPPAETVTPTEQEPTVTPNNTPVNTSAPLIETENTKDVQWVMWLGASVAVVVVAAVVLTALKKRKR